MDMEKKSPLRDVMNSTMEKVREMVDANNIVGAVKLAGVKAFGGQVELVGTLGSQREGRAAQLVEQEREKLKTAQSMLEALDARIEGLKQA